MHSPFWHTTLPQTTTPILAAQGHDLTDDWSLPSAHFVDSWCPFQCSFGCILLWSRCFENNVPFNSTTLIYLINLLWKLGLGFGLDSELHCLAFFMENKESEHLTLCEVHGR